MSDATTVPSAMKGPTACKRTAIGGSLSMPAGVERASASRTRRPAITRVRHDLGQRHQHEGALEQARMRQREAGLVEREVVVGDQVDVDRARTPALLARAVAAERALDVQRAVEQRARRQRRSRPRSRN